MPTLIFKIRYIYLFLILAFLSIIFLPSMHCTCKSTWWHHSVCNERWLECLCWCVWIFFPPLYLQMEEWCSGATGAPSSSSFSSENRKRDIYCRWKRESSQTSGAVGGWVGLRRGRAAGGERQGVNKTGKTRQERGVKREYERTGRCWDRGEIEWRGGKGNESVNRRGEEERWGGGGEEGDRQTVDRTSWE